MLRKTIKYPVLRHYHKSLFCFTNSINDPENHQFFNETRQFFEGCEVIGTNGPFCDSDFLKNSLVFQKPELEVLSF
jgi:hypothetical protein